MPFSLSQHQNISSCGKLVLWWSGEHCCAWKQLFCFPRLLIIFPKDFQNRWGTILRLRWIYQMAAAGFWMLLFFVVGVMNSLLVPLPKGRQQALWRGCSSGGPGASWIPGLEWGKEKTPVSQLVHAPHPFLPPSSWEHFLWQYFVGISVPVFGMQISKF